MGGGRLTLKSFSFGSKKSFHSYLEMVVTLNLQKNNTVSQDFIGYMIHVKKAFFLGSNNPTFILAMAHRFSIPFSYLLFHQISLSKEMQM